MKPLSTTKLRWIRTQIVLAIAILTSLIVAPSGRAVTGKAEPEGTWVVRVRVNDAPPGFPVPFDALETYSRGGGIVTSNNNPLIPRPGQGAWAKTGSDEYTASIIFFFFDPIGAPIGTVEVTHRFTIQDNSYSGTGEARFKNLNGDPLFPEHPGPFTFTTRAERVTAAAAEVAQSAETYVGRLEGLNDVIGIDIHAIRPKEPRPRAGLSL